MQLNPAAPAFVPAATAKPTAPLTSSALRAIRSLEDTAARCIQRCWRRRQRLWRAPLDRALLAAAATAPLPAPAWASWSGGSGGLAQHYPRRRPGVSGFKFLAPDALASAIIGRSASGIAALRRSTQADVGFSGRGQVYPGTGLRVGHVTARAEAPVRAAVKQVAVVLGTLAEAGTEHCVAADGFACLLWAVLPEVVADGLLGHVRALRARTGARIRVEPEVFDAKLSSWETRRERLVALEGSPQAVSAAALDLAARADRDAAGLPWFPEWLQCWRASPSARSAPATSAWHAAWHAAPEGWKEPWPEATSGPVKRWRVQRPVLVRAQEALDSPVLAELSAGAVVRSTGAERTLPSGVVRVQVEARGVRGWATLSAVPLGGPVLLEALGPEGGPRGDGGAGGPQPRATANKARSLASEGRTGSAYVRRSRSQGRWVPKASAGSGTGEAEGEAPEAPAARPGAVQEAAGAAGETTAGPGEGATEAVAIASAEAPALVAEAADERALELAGRFVIRSADDESVLELSVPLAGTAADLRREICASVRREMPAGAELQVYDEFLDKVDRVLQDADELGSLERGDRASLRLVGFSLEPASPRLVGSSLEPVPAAASEAGAEEAGAVAVPAAQTGPGCLGASREPDARWRSRPRDLVAACARCPV